MKTTSDAKQLLNGLLKKRKATQFKRNYKLTEDQVREAREVWDLARADNDGFPPYGLCSDLARHYGVSTMVMNQIVTRHSYKWVK